MGQGAYNRCTPTTDARADALPFNPQQLKHNFSIKSQVVHNSDFIKYSWIDPTVRPCQSVGYSALRSFHREFRLHLACELGWGNYFRRPHR